MTTRSIATRIFLPALAVYLLCVSGIPARADRVDEVTKGSYFADEFEVKVKQEKDEVRVTVVVPEAMDEYKLSSLSLWINDSKRISTNGSELEFVIDKKDFEQASVTVGYIDPDHDPEDFGGGWGFVLDISSLGAEDEKN